MKTRTLLLLALGCGIAIMLAGAVFLVQLSNQEDSAPAVELGTEATAGDMTVVVDGSSESGGVLAVDVGIGGVDDPDGAAGFRLIASGEAFTPVPADGAADTCGATGPDVARCTLRFDVSSARGASRVLFYERGDVTLRWVLG